MAPWREFTSLEVTSTGLVPALEALLGSQEDLQAIARLTGPEARKVVDFISQAINSPLLAEPLRKEALRLLCKLCGACKLLPTDCVLNEELVETKIQIGSGGFADVWQGTYGVMQVAIKRLRVDEQDDFTELYKRFCKEVVIWRRLSHPNVLKLLGVSTYGNDLRMISKLMRHGNIMAYLGAQPSANRLQLLAHVGEGLSYLHEMDLVHGDLKGANVLVDDECTPLIADFGLMSIMKDSDTALDTQSLVGGIGTPRWSAPELLDPPVFGFSSCQPSKQSDCYSLGMTIYEVLTGKQPLYDVKTNAVIIQIVRGIRPERPRLSHAIGFTDPVWTMVEGCWKEHSAYQQISYRPDVRTVVRCLAEAAALWTPTPPLNDVPFTADESETFSIVTPSDSACTLGSMARRDKSLDRDEEGEEDNRTIVPPYGKKSVQENLHELADRFYGYYLQSHKTENLDWVIKHLHKAVTMYPHPHHPGRLRSLTRLAGHYYERHEISQNINDIELSIEKSSDVARRTTVDDPARPGALLILAKAQYVYYGRNPQQGSLEAVIECSSEAARFSPVDNQFRAETLMVLSAALYDRYQVSLGRPGFQPPHNDLDHAISNATMTIDLFRPDDPRIPDLRIRLSIFLFSRYQRLKNLNDLRQSIHHARTASGGITPDKRPESLVYFGHLLTHLSHDSQTLTELAKCSREALDLFSPGDDRRAGAIHNLVIASHRMYVTLNSTAHLDEAIDYNRQLKHFLPYGSELWYSQRRLHRTLLEYRLSERQLDIDLAEKIDTDREIAAADLQCQGYDHYYSFQPATPPPSTSDTPPDGSPAVPPFEYRPPQHWSPRPYYSDNSAVSVPGSVDTTSSVGTGDCGSGSDSSLVENPLDSSFTEPAGPVPYAPHS